MTIRPFYSILLGILLLLYAPNMHGQKYKQEINKIMDAARQKKFLHVPKDLITNDNAKDIFKYTSDFLTDSIQNVRSKAYFIIYKTGVTSDDHDFKEKIVNTLIIGTRDSDYGIIGTNISYLENFEKQHFNNEAKNNLIRDIDTNIPHFDDYIRLIGYACDRNAIPALQALLNSIESASDRWAIHIALSRLGVGDQTDYCLQFVKKFEVNDDVVYELLPDLIYTRNKKCIDYLFEVVNSDNKNCQSPNADVDIDILCAYKVMEYLAPVIKDFPIETNTSGSLKTSSYPDALNTVRVWYSNNKENYIILDNFY